MSIPRIPTSPVAAAVAALAVLLATPALAHSPLDGRIRVHNDRATPVEVTIDGDQTVRVRAHHSQVVKRVPNGVRVVRIAGRSGPPVVEHVTVPVKGKARLRIAPLRGAAVLRNHSGVTMDLRVDGRPAGRVADRGRLKLPDLPAGPHRLVATPVDAWARGGAPLERTFRVRAGDRVRVKLDAWVASLEVRNPFPGRVALFVDGVRRADLRHDRAAVVPRLVPGTHRVSLRGPGRILAESTVRVAPGERATWRPVLPHGSVRISNDSPRVLRVHLDGRRVGRLQPGQRLVLDDIPAGQHTIVAKARRGFRMTRTVDVHPRRPAIVTLDNPAPVHHTTWFMPTH